MENEAPAVETQPIPAEEIKAFYVEQLEIRVDNAEVEEAARAIRARVADAQARLSKCFTLRGLDAKDWNVNLKTGLVTPAIKGPVAMPAPPPVDPVAPTSTSEIVPEPSAPESPEAPGASEDSPEAPATA